VIEVVFLVSKAGWNLDSHEWFSALHNHTEHGMCAGQGWKHLRLMSIVEFGFEHRASHNRLFLALLCDVECRQSLGFWRAF
jgi:hypothetical protein